LLFADDLSDETSEWTGVSRTAEEIMKIREEVTKTVEEIGGKVDVQLKGCIFFMEFTLSVMRFIRRQLNKSPNDLAPKITSSKCVDDSGG
jgi:hypothetical protein